MATFTKQAIAVLGPGKTGLSATLQYTVKDTAGSVLVATVTSTGIVESGTSGTYFVGIASFDCSWSGRIEWTTVAAGLLAAEDFAPVPSVDSSGRASANLAAILGTALTETAGQIAAAFVKFFNKSSPTGTVNSLPDAVAGAASGVAIVGSNMGAVSSIGTGGITAASIAADAITAAKIADGAIDAATFAAGAIDNAAIATDAIGAAELAADAITEIQNGLATPTNITAGTITTVTTLTNKTGFSLASTGLNAIAITDVTDDADARSTFPKMVRALFNRFYNAVTQTATAQVVKNDSGTTISTMAVSDDATTVTKAKSS